MPYVKINETDNTIYRNTVNSDDNIVFIPGVAITGPLDTPVLCNSYKDFINTFGKTAPETDVGSYCTSWDYAVNLLLAGMPVLYYRVGTSSLGESLVSKATAVITTNVAVTTNVRTYLLDTVDVTDTETEEHKQAYDEWIDGGSEGTNPVSTYINSHRDETVTSTVNANVATVQDNYGGTFGNTYAYGISISNSSVMFKLYTVSTVNRLTINTLLETIKLADISDLSTMDDDYTTKVANKILNTWGGIVDGVAPIVDGEYVSIIFDNESEELVQALSYLTSTDNLVTFSGGADADLDSVVAELSNIYPKLEDKYLYDFKYITSGGYTDTYTGSNSDSYPISKAMINLAEKRQDCVCFIDPALSIPSTEIKPFFENFNSSYATGYAPWMFVRTENNNEMWMPPSYVFLHTLAKSLKSGNVLWNPPAGVNRATVSSVIKPQYEINSALLDSWQNTEGSQCVNPIMKLRQYGYVIYGQKTLYYIVNNDDNLRSALQELGVRLTANEIKRAINTISIAMTFEQNNIRTWNEFRGRLDPYLAQMKADRGLNSYEIIMDSTTTTDADLNNNVVRGIVRVSIARAAEKFIIGFELTSSSNATMTEDEEL